MGVSIMKSLVFLTFGLQLVSAATHSMQYIYTAVTPGLNFPEFTSVGLLDGEPFTYYDSVTGKETPKMGWIKEVVDPDYWNRNTQRAQGAQEIFKVNLGTAMQRFNQTGGVHTIQRMYGCELHDDGTKKAYWGDGYDGEDFISFDLETSTYIAPTPQAVITKNTWDTLPTTTVVRKNYLLNQCIEWLQKYVGYGRSTLERKVSPKADLFRKDSSSPVVCHATGFFPKEVMISWKKNGEDLEEDVELRETLHNQDGTFQKRSILTVSPDKLDKDEYTCVIQHAGLQKEMGLEMSDCRILSGGGSVGMIIGAVVAVLLLVLIVCVAVFFYQRGQNNKNESAKGGFKPVPVSTNTASDDSSSNNS